ncbi:hypothetical protein E2320_016521 [Naja naja]|nr:hypothetical protein E2320_016521 [Naja naja]
MRLVTWNVNGLRAGAGSAGLRQLLDSLGADLVCLQETKITRDLLEEPLAIVEGYSSYFSFSRTRSGYSGVATFCKASATPEAAEEGLSGLFTKHSGAVGCYGNTEDFTVDELKALDSEGRAVITRHRICTSEQQETVLTVINVYCPRADPEKPERGDFKLQFYRLLQESFQEHPGRRWLDGFLWETGRVSENENLFVDTFRFLNPSQDEAYTCWCNVTGSRHLNYGTRIDYILADRALALLELTDAQIMPEVLGSDHCPVQAVLKSTCLAAPRCPPLCTQFLPEFAGTQQKLSRFLVKVEQTQLPEKGQKRSKARKTALGDLKKRRTGPAKKGQGDLRSFFKAGNLDAEPVDGGRGQSVLNVVQRAAAEDSGKQPPMESPERIADKYVGEGVSGVTQTPVESPKKAPCKGVTSKAAMNCEKNILPSKQNQSGLWKSLLPGPAHPPRCKAHKEPCVLRTVKKQGPNCGRRFFVCARPQGKPSDPRARCDYFLWAS